MRNMTWSVQNALVVGILSLGIGAAGAGVGAAGYGISYGVSINIKEDYEGKLRLLEGRANLPYEKHIIDLNGNGIPEEFYLIGGELSLAKIDGNPVIQYSLEPKETATPTSPQ